MLLQIVHHLAKGGCAVGAFSFVRRSKLQELVAMLRQDTAGL